MFTQVSDSRYTESQEMKQSQTLFTFASTLWLLAHPRAKAQVRSSW